MLVLHYFLLNKCYSLHAVVVVIVLSYVSSREGFHQLQFSIILLSFLKHFRVSIFAGQCRCRI